MPSPFPGMDPYLENPGLWPDVHVTSSRGFRDFWRLNCGQSIVVRVEERVYIADESDETFKPQLRIPDVEVASRPAGRSHRSRFGSETSQLEVAEPVVATTWFEEEIHEAFLKIIDLANHVTS